MTIKVKSVDFPTDFLFSINYRTANIPFSLNSEKSYLEFFNISVDVSLSTAIVTV